MPLLQGSLFSARDLSRDKGLSAPQHPGCPGYIQAALGTSSLTGSLMHGKVRYAFYSNTQGLGDTKVLGIPAVWP